MSKSDTLGASPAFSHANTARSARAQMFAAATGRVLPDADGTLPVDAISQNPDNPRDHMRDLDEMTRTVAELGVIVAITVASVDAYLATRPEREHELDQDTHYLVVDGHRRLEAARRVGLTRIKVLVDDARVATDEALLEAAFVANYHRDNMTELEEAHALEALVSYYGNQTKASQRLGMSQSTISSKLSLLKLNPVLQADLAEGRRQVKHVRNLGKLSPQEQVAQADARAAADEAEKHRLKPAVSSAQPVQPEAESFTAVKPALAPEPEPAADYHPVIIQDAPPAAEADECAPAAPAVALVPDPRPESDQKGPTRMPWDDPQECARIVIAKMKPADRQQLVERLLEQERIDVTVGLVEARTS